MMCATSFIDPKLCPPRVGGNGSTAGSVAQA
jgi:hypothetical protein